MTQQTRTDKQRRKELMKALPEKLNQKWQGIFVGLTLGDLTLIHRKKSNKTQRKLEYTHNRPDHIDFIHNLLKDWTVSSKPKLYLKDAQPHSFYFFVIGHSALNLLWDYFPTVHSKKTYKAGAIEKYLTLEGLRYWILDDGSPYKNGGLTLHTSGFQKQEVEQMCYELKKKWGLKLSLHKKKNNRLGKPPYWTIYIWKASYDYLMQQDEVYNIIKQVPSLAHKRVRRLNQRAKTGVGGLAQPPVFFQFFEAIKQLNLFSVPPKATSGLGLRSSPIKGGGVKLRLFLSICINSCQFLFISIYSCFLSYGYISLASASPKPKPNRTKFFKTWAGCRSKNKVQS